jgi:hypothetical protein
MEMQPLVSHWSTGAAPVNPYPSPYYSNMGMEYLSPMQTAQSHHHHNAHHLSHQQISQQHFSQMGGQAHMSALGVSGVQRNAPNFNSEALAMDHYAAWR